jgi:acetoin utilization protein AcuB
MSQSVPIPQTGSQHPTGVRVIDIASKAVVTMDMDDTLAQAQRLFEEHRFHHLIVVHAGAVMGVLSDRDLLKHLSPFIGAIDERKRDADSLNKRAHQVMTRSPITVTPGTTVCKACELMLNAGVTCLPVVDETGSLAGIVTWRDLLRWLAWSTGCNVPPTDPNRDQKGRNQKGPAAMATGTKERDKNGRDQRAA